MRIPPNILTFLARRLLIDARSADLLPIRYPVGAWAGSESRVHTRGKLQFYVHQPRQTTRNTIRMSLKNSAQQQTRQVHATAFAQLRCLSPAAETIR